MGSLARMGSGIKLLWNAMVTDLLLSALVVAGTKDMQGEKRPSHSSLDMH